MSRVSSRGASNQQLADAQYHEYRGTRRSVHRRWPVRPCTVDNQKDLRDGVRCGYCRHRHVGATYDTNADKWEAHGPVTDAESEEALRMMDAQLEAASEVDRATAQE